MSALVSDAMAPLSELGVLVLAEPHQALEMLHKLRSKSRWGKLQSAWPMVARMAHALVSAELKAAADGRCEVPRTC